MNNNHHPTTALVAALLLKMATASRVTTEIVQLPQRWLFPMLPAALGGCLPHQPSHVPQQLRLSTLLLAAEFGDCIS